MAYATPTAADLGVWLNVTTDSPRATQIIAWAEQRCQSIVTPLPDGAQSVVLAVAARLYSNPQAVIQEGAGPFSVNFGSPASGGLWLTREEKRALRLLNGGGGAFTIDTISNGTPCVQSVTIFGSPTSGTFTLNTGYGTTAALGVASTAPTVQAAFNALQGLSGVIVSGTAGSWTITFPATLGAVPQMTVASSSFTGGTQPQVLTGMVRVGVLPPASNLPWWDRNVDVGLSGQGWGWQ